MVALALQALIIGLVLAPHGAWAVAAGCAVWLVGYLDGRHDVIRDLRHHR